MRTTIRCVSLSVAGLAAVLLSRAAAAQVELPRDTPWAKVAQQVGLTEIAVDYNSPAVKGRKLWGQAIPYDRLWVIGGNPAARIKFSKDVTVGEKTVPAGAYVLLAIPAKGEWTIILNKAVDQTMTVQSYKPELDAVRFQVTAAKAAPSRERLTFLFASVTDEKASLDLEWDSVRVSLPIKTNTAQQVMNTLAGLDNAWRSHADAARYMLENKKDYDAGLKYINQSLGLKDDCYSRYLKGVLLSAKGEGKEAQEQFEKAYDLAQKIGDTAALEPGLWKALADWNQKHRQSEPRAKTGKSAVPAAPVEPEKFVSPSAVPPLASAPHASALVRK